jgi:inosose dehydratase
MHQFAINPLQWLAGPDGNLDRALAPKRQELIARVAASGFRAMSIAVLDDAAVEQYAQELEDAGLAPAPGYVSFDLTTTDLDPVFATVDHLARAHRALGLSEIFLAGSAVPERMAVPAVGVATDEEREKLIARNVRAVSERFLDAGVRAGFHQHIGTWVETEGELLHLLESTPADAVFLGPDTGHLTWAGIDPVAFLGEHADRVRGLHLKDIHQDRLRAATGSYSQVIAQRVLTEPGRGDIDNDRVLAALGEDFDGWVVIEVDHPDGISPDESAQRAAAWANSRA